MFKASISVLFFYPPPPPPSRTKMFNILKGSLGFRSIYLLPLKLISMCIMHLTRMCRHQLSASSLIYRQFIAPTRELQWFSRAGISIS